MFKYKKYVTYECYEAYEMDINEEYVKYINDYISDNSFWYLDTPVVVTEQMIKDSLNVEDSPEVTQVYKIRSKLSDNCMCEEPLYSIIKDIVEEDVEDYLLWREEDDVDTRNEIREVNE